MTDVARFTVAPPMRCCHFDQKSVSHICGRIATHRSSQPTPQTTGFFCEHHKRDTDVPITGPRLFRRVSFQLEVQLAGVSPIPAMAQAEALGRLEAAIEQLGGVLGVKAASSVVGLYEPPAPVVNNPHGRYRAK